MHQALTGSLKLSTTYHQGIVVRRRQCSPFLECVYPELNLQLKKQHKKRNDGFDGGLNSAEK
jgi:hypothetical protein